MIHSEKIPLVYTIQDIETGKKQFKITIDADYLKKVYQTINDEVFLSPEQSFDVRFGEEVEKIVTLCCYQVIKDSDVQIVGDPVLNMEHMGFATSVIFTMDVNVLPYVILPNCRSLKLEMTLTAEEAQDDDFRETLRGQTIMYAVMDRTLMEIPNHLIENELISSWKETEGPKFSHLPAKIQEMSMKNWLRDPQLRQQAEERLKSILVLLQLAKQENLAIEEAEIEKLAIQVGAPPENLQNPQWVDAVRNQLLITKALAWLHQHVDVTERIEG